MKQYESKDNILLAVFFTVIYFYNLIILLS
jgi:hypothetical protein